MTKDGLDLAIATQQARQHIGELDVTLTIESFLEIATLARDADMFKELYHDQQRQKCEAQDALGTAQRAEGVAPSDEAVLCANGWFGMSGVSPTPALVDMLAEEILRLKRESMNAGDSK